MPGNYCIAVQSDLHDDWCHSCIIDPEETVRKYSEKVAFRHEATQKVEDEEFHTI